MTKNIFAGVNNVARKPNAIYVGVNNVARKVKEVYAGVGGVARKVWPNNLIPDDRYQSLSYIGVDVNGGYGMYDFSFPAHTTTYVNYNIRIVYKFEMQYDTTQIISTASSYDANRATFFCIGRGETYGYYTTPVYYDGSTASNQAFYYRMGSPHPRDTQRFTLEFEQANVGSGAERTNLFTTTEELFIPNSLYTLDFNNNKKVYLYNSKGYYSIASHNLVGTYNPFHSSFTLHPDFANQVFFYFTLSRGNNIFHSAQIYNGSTLQRDIIPCYRISDRKVGLYDLVNRVGSFNEYSSSLTIDYDHLLYSE